MLSNGPYRLALGAALACCLGLRSAFGAPPADCAEPKLNVQLPSDPKWDSATPRLIGHLRALSDLDRCARVTVRPDRTGVTVKITTVDGREAQRHVETVDALLT